MSFVDSLEETCFNRNDFFSQSRETGIDDESELSNETTPTFSNNLGLHTNPLYADLESPMSAISNASHHLGGEKLAIETTNKDTSFKDIFLLNVDEAQKLPLIPAMNCDYNFSSSVAPSHGVFSADPLHTEIWSPHYDYTHSSSFTSNEESCFYQSSRKPSYSELASAAPIEVIDLTQSPSLDDTRVDSQIPVDGNPTASPLNQADHNTDQLENELSNPSTNFSLLEPTFSTDNPFLPTSPLESISCASISAMNHQVAMPLSWKNADNGVTLSNERQDHVAQEYTTNYKKDANLMTSSGSRKKNRHHSKKMNVTIQLANRELWRKFYEIGTEMIITKAGRRMFPSIKLEIRGLQPLSYYIMAIDIVPVDNNRYRYVYHSSQWMAAGTTDSHPAPRTYIHPDSPSRGEIWMRQPITFDKLKLTNHEANKKNHVILHSMHKYQPRVHVIECSGNLPVNLTQLLPWNKRVDDVLEKGRTTVTFPECAFTTVTAYQNQQITKLKIDRNPFAKGFRETNKQWRPKLSEDSSAGNSDHSKSLNNSFLPNPVNTYCPATTGDNTHHWQTGFAEIQQNVRYDSAREDFIHQPANAVTCLTESNFQCFPEKILSIPTTSSNIPIFHDDVMGDVTNDASARNRSFQDLLFDSTIQSVKNISNYAEEIAVSTRGQI